MGSHKVSKAVRHNIFRVNQLFTLICPVLFLQPRGSCRFVGNHPTTLQTTEDKLSAALTFYTHLPSVVFTASWFMQVCWKSPHNTANYRRQDVNCVDILHSFAQCCFYNLVVHAGLLEITPQHCKLQKTRCQLR